jgi:succinoglycan biosynthesis transport protein ExoP
MSDLIPSRPAQPIPSRPRARGREWHGPTRPNLPPGDHVGFREAFIVLRRRWRVVAGITGAVLGAVGFLVLRDPSVYRATATVQIGDARQTVASGIEEPQAPVGRLTDRLLSQIELLRSRSVIGMVVDSVGYRLQPLEADDVAALVTRVWVAPSAPPDTLRLVFSDAGLRAVTSHGETTAGYGEPIELEYVRFVVTRRPKVDRASFLVLAPQRAVDRLLEGLSVRPRMQTNVVDVSYESPRAALAQAVVNTLVQSYQTLDAQGAQQQSRRRRQFLEEQLSRTDSLMKQAQSAMSRFRQREQVFSSREKLAGQQAELTALDARHGTLKAERGMYATLLSQLQSGDSTTRREGLQAMVSTPAVAANPIVSQLQEQLLRYRLALDSATTGEWRAAPSDPDVQRLETLAANTERELIAALGSHVTSLDAQIAAVNVQRGATAAALRELPASEAEEVRLAGQLETFHRLDEQLRMDYQRAHMAEAVEVGSIEIVDLATLPYKPASKLTTVKLGVGLLLGLLLGGSSAFLIERLSPSIRRRQDAEDILQVPSLAVIPHVENALNSRKRTLLGRKSSPAAVRTSNAVLRTALLAPLPSAGAEAYRVLRTTLMFSDWARDLRSIAVTSAVPGDGKTLTAANLAAALAGERQRVLLVDADPWHGRMHHLFGVRPTPGLKEVLLGEASLDQAVQQSDVSDLWLLTVGGRPAHAAEIVTGARVRELLGQLEQAFDRVVFDTPPVLAAADAVILSAVLDGTVFVVRAGDTDREAAQTAIEQLATVGANVVGAIINDPDGESAKYGEYYYHRYAERK